MIDYIIEYTQVPKIQIIGYSQGTTAMFAMVSEKPSYNDKILSMHALAPVAFESEMTSPVILTYKPYLNLIIVIAKNRFKSNVYNAYIVFLK